MYSSYLEQVFNITQEDKFLKDFQKLKLRLSGLGTIFSIQYSAKSNSIIVYKLFIKEYQRNSGLGSKSLSLIISLADKYEKKVSLTPSDVFGANLKRLIRFYRRFGFQKNPRPTLSEKFVRYPLTTSNDSGML